MLAAHLEENSDHHPKVVLEQQKLDYAEEDSTGCDFDGSAGEQMSADGGNKLLSEAPSKAKQGAATRGTEREAAGNSLAGGNSPPLKKAKTKAAAKVPPSGTGGNQKSLASFFGSGAK